MLETMAVDTVMMLLFLVLEVSYNLVVAYIRSDYTG